MKERNYKATTIQVCKNCQGEGFVMEEVYKGAVLPHNKRIPDPVRKTCDVCNGSGRVRRAVAVDVTITPFEPK